MLKVGGVTSTVTDCDALLLPEAPESEANIVAVMVSGPLGGLLTVNVQLVHGDPAGPVGVALTGAAVPSATVTLLMASFACPSNVSSLLGGATFPTNRRNSCRSP